MRIVFMSCPAFGLPALMALRAAGHQIVAVYTQPPRPAGRGQAERPCPVHARAVELGLPVRHPRTLRDAQVQAELAALQADIAVVVAYGLILPQGVLDTPRLGCVNIHASILPRWRGAAPIHRAIEAGDRETGISIMQMEAGLDTGPVLLERRAPIRADETTGELHDRLAALGAEAVVQALATFDRLVPRPQAQSGITYATKIDKAEARIDWARPADEVARKVRALAPAPGAWCMAGSERLRLIRARPVPGSGSPGQVLSATSAESAAASATTATEAAPAAVVQASARLRVACADGAIEILEAQREGRRALPIAEVLRGFTLPARMT